MTPVRPFNRHPRFLRPAPATNQFDLPPPPTREVAQPPQAVMVVVPVLTTGSILLFGIISGQTYLIYLGIMVTIASMLTPLLMYAGNRRQVRRRNEKRHQRFGALLDSTEQEIATAADAVRLALEDVHPTPDLLQRWVEMGRLWERRRSDPDFLDIALGVGTVDSGLTVTVNRAGAHEAEIFTDLDQRADNLRQSGRVLENAPVHLSLKENAVVGIEGPRRSTLDLARAMILEALVCCGPDELAVLVATPPESERDWGWVAGIPHGVLASDDARLAGAVATTSKSLAVMLAREVGPRTQMVDLDARERPASTAGLPHLLVVLDAYDPLSELHEIPLLQETLSRAGELALTVITISDRSGASPGESAAVISVAADGRAALRPVRSSQEARTFQPLAAPQHIAEAVVEVIGHLRLVSDLSFVSDSSNDLLLDLLGRRPLPSTKPSWRPPEPATLLTATFGVQSDGGQFTLDLKEGAAGGAGPHGLLVGATGSGKSELLRSMVTSLALSHDPEWLQMAFVDFKGGAAFEALAELPHCVGLITNILDDLSLVERMRTSLAGELLARQHQLAATGEDLQGIRDYWALRAKRPELEPMPYLLVVIDEFGELLEVDPAFLEILLAVGRQGRSLGVHLVLSSQRLESGRIRGLESYLSYRIALRTFNADESRAAIGTKAAAELPPLAGHGYFRSADTFQRFKASQVSVEKGAPETTLGQPGRNRSTDLTRIVDWLSSVPKAPPLWQRPLPNTARAELLMMDDERLALPATPIQSGLPVALGLLDDPARRRQDPLVLDVERLGGHLAVTGAPQSGRSSAMATYLLQAARAYPGYLLRFFVLDFGGGLLAATRDLPNVGAYATPQEPDRVTRIMAEMLTLLDERPLEFRRHGVNSMAQQRSRASQALDGVVQGHTVLVIDNYAAFKERYPELEPVVERVLIEGAAFGLHLFTTSSRWTDMSSRKLEQIAARIELRLNEPADSQHGRAKASAIRTSGPGRGLVALGRQVQLAVPQLGSLSTVPEPLATAAAAVADVARDSWSGFCSPPLLLLDDLRPEVFRHAQESVLPGRILLGMNESGFTAVEYRPGHDGNVLIFGDLGSGRTSALARMLAGFLPTDRSGPEAPSQVYVVDFRGDLLHALDPPASVVRATSPAAVETMVQNLRKELEERLSDGCGDGAPLLLVVDDYELVQAMTPMGRPGALADLSPYFLVAARLRLSVVINQLATNSMMRAGDLVIKRALESGAWRLHFSIAARSEILPGNMRGRRLAPGVASLDRNGQAVALCLTLPGVD